MIMLRLANRHRPRRLIIVWMMIVLITGGGCLKMSGTPPRPQEPIEQAARSAIITYAHALADSFDEAAAQLASQSLTTAAETNQHLQSANVAARRQAFHEVDELLNAELGNDQWDVQRARQLFEGISRGLRSVP